MGLFIRVQAQEKLPNFKIKDLGQKGIEISWINPFKNCQQLSIQRSTDSLQFKTIANAKTPNLYENSFIDKSQQERPLFYRIFYIIKSGKYYFSIVKSIRSKPQQTPTTITNNNNNNNINTQWKPSKFVYCIGKGTPTILLPDAQKHLYRLIFKEEKGNTIFELNAIKEIETYLDKANFVHTGWFLFELFEDDKLKEQGRILIQKDATNR
jgi:hypothetical protein